MPQHTSTQACTRPRVKAALAITLGLAMGLAQADAPLQSETADAIGAGDCQVELGLARTTVRGLPALKSWDLLGSCGLDGSSQLALGYGQAKLDGGEKAQLLGLAGKTTLVTPEGARTGWGLAYGLQSLKATPSSWKLDSLAVTAVATRELASGWLGHANLGWHHSRGEKLNTTFWSLGVETTGTWVWAADVFGDDRNKPGVSSGLGLDLGRGLSANIGYLLVLEQPRLRQVTLGAKLTF